MSKTFQILAIDGGGLKGLFSAAILAHLEKDHNVKITDHFDLILGTSTGGIIGLGMGMGLSPREIVQFYVRFGPKIFPNSIRFKTRKFWRSQFPLKALKNALTECFGETLLGESKKRLVIPAYNIGNDDVYIFKTPHHSRLKRDFKEPMWKVALATSSAPTFFPAYSGIDHQRLVDGGVWANNPSMIGVVEAVSILGVSLGNIKVFNLGNTEPVKGRPKNLDTGGEWHWRKQAVEIILRGQSISAFNQVQHLLGQEKAKRLSPKVPDGLFEMEKISEKELMAKAAHESRVFSPEFSKLFLPHRADTYVPLNSVTK